MFTNYFIGRSVSMADQFTAIFEIIMKGILTDDKRATVQSGIFPRRR